MPYIYRLIVLPFMSRKPLTEKLILYFILINLTAIGIVGYYSFRSARQAQMERTYDQLASVKYLKKKQIEQFYSGEIRLVKSLAESLKYKHIIPKNQAASAGISETDFPVKMLLRQIRPEDQLFFITGNRTFLLDPGGKLIPCDPRFDPDSVISKAGKEDLVITDYMKKLSGAGWVQYILTRIEDRPQPAYLAIALSSETIASLVADRSPLSGLGYSGEAYLAGRDRLLRTDSRFRPDAILRCSINTATARLAFSGQEGTWLLNDYRGVPVLGSFASLPAPLPDWVLIAEIDLVEAMIPIYTIRNNVIFITVFIAVIVLLATWFFAKRITRPIIQLRTAALELANGNPVGRVDVDRNDEIGELAQAFNHMNEQLREKELLLEKEKNLRMRAAFDGQDIERQRLSRELHDGLGQSLIAQKLRLEALDAGDKADLAVRELKECADQLVEEVRRISNALMPAQLNQFGLEPALRQLCKEVSKYGKIEVRFDATGNFEPMNRKTKTYLFRIVQEALNNCIKHAEATSASVELAQTRDHVFISISDNGKGFDTGRACPGNGLHTMRERVELLHGTISFQSVPDNGTTIEIQLPFSK